MEDIKIWIKEVQTTPSGPMYTHIVRIQLSDMREVLDEKKEMKLTKEKLKQIIKEELKNIMKKEGLDQGEKDDLASLKSKEKALAAKRSKNDSDALKDEHDALKDKIKALKDKEHQ